MLDDFFQNVGGRVSRRAMLRGAGVAMALPWLESIPVWGAPSDDSQKEKSAEDTPDEGCRCGASADYFPKRMAVLFMACGVNGNHWWAKGEGEKMELSKTLEPMAPFKEKMNFIHG